MERNKTFDWNRSGFYSFVQEGDNLIKVKGDSAIRILRDNLDTMVLIDYGCNE